MLVPAMERRAALPSGFACFFRRPFVRGASFVSGLAALAGNQTLLALIHGRKAAMLFFHVLS
jgi:hypothetical protein